MTEFQLIGYLGLLAEHGVEYLIVGGVGSRIQGAATTTQDLDIMPAPEPENLDRLAAALNSRTGTRKKPATSTTYIDHPTVAAHEFKTETICSFETTLGVLDVLMELPGVGTFDDVRPNAKRYQFEDKVLLVASLDDIILSKEVSDRAKDHRAMDALYEARERLRRETDAFELSDQQLEVTTESEDQGALDE